MKIRIIGTRGECDRLLVCLGQVVAVREVSDFYPNRPPSALGRVYLEVDLATSATAGVAQPEVAGLNTAAGCAGGGDRGAGCVR